MSVRDGKISERWARRLVIGLPVITIVLVVVTANLIGGILISQDLRHSYEDLVDQASVFERAAAAQPAAAADDEAVEGESAAAPAAEAPEERPEVTVTLTLTEFDIEADVDEVPAWADVTFEVVNEGLTPHDAVTVRSGSAMLDSGESDTFTAEAPGSGVMEIICTVAGHEEAGMVLELPVAGGDETDEDAGDDQAEATTADGDAPGSEAASPDNAADYDGDKPALERRDPTVPPLPDGDVHDVTFTVEERVMQVAPDVWQEVWTFNGEAPGPTLRVKVGDTVNLTLVNPEEAEVGHSIDFHASQVAWNDEMRTIAPGEELVYSFEATHAGVFMYHCGTAPALHHIGNAMHGLIIVEPEEGLDEVDHEFFFIQHEYYLGPQGQPGDLARMSESAAAPDLVVFNGVAGQYVDEPIQVEPEETIRAFVVNNGPSADSSFHVVGTIFDTVMKEGFELLADNPQGWGSQAVDLAPAQGGYVEFSLATDGLYPIVTHAFNHVDLGGLGLFQAGDGGEMPAGGH